MNFTGADFKDWVLIIAGNIFIVILVIRSVGYYARKEWGEFVGHIVGAILVGGLIYANDAAMALLKQAWTLITS